MRGSASLVSRARRVQQHYDEHLEDDLSDLIACLELELSPSGRQQLGDPHALVLETRLVMRQAARLRAAPWQKVATTERRNDQQVDSAI